ncbi:hypothetical protein ACHWQZ_G013877 [Mnemiopsis leidyi]
MSNDGPEGSHKGALASSTVDGVSVNSSLEARELTQSGQCSTCKALDAKESTVCCFFCSKTFHALCYDILEEKTVQRKPRSDNSCTKTFYTNYCSNVKDKNQGTKFGSFVFICDPCRTKNETQAARNTNDHVRVLDNRVSALSSDISDLKELLNKALRPPVTDSVDNGQMTSNQESPSQTSNINVWCDKERVQSLLVVQKEANIESTQLEKTVINHGIQVQKRYVDKKGDTVLVLPSKQARDKLKCELQSSGVSNDQLREPKQRYPTISMVGLPKTADINDKKSIQNTLLSQNPTLARCLNASSSALFDIISVKPLRMNENVKQAIIRVSDDVRNPSSITFLLWNSRSLSNKYDDLMCLLQDEKVDIACITETWLTDQANFVTSAIKSYGYNIIHTYRADTRGGGTAVIYHSSLKVATANLRGHSFQTFEYVVGTLRCDADMKITIVSLYRTGPITSRFFEEFDEFLAVILLKSDYLVLTGDFNIHMETGDSNSAQLLQITDSYGLKQLVKVPTHRCGVFLVPFSFYTPSSVFLVPFPFYTPSSVFLVSFLFFTPSSVFLVPFLFYTPSSVFLVPFPFYTLSSDFLVSFPFYTPSSVFLVSFLFYTPSSVFLVPFPFYTPSSVFLVPFLFYTPSSVFLVPFPFYTLSSVFLVPFPCYTPSSVFLVPFLFYTPSSVFLVSFPFYTPSSVFLVPFLFYTPSSVFLVPFLFYTPSSVFLVPFPF